LNPLSEPLPGLPARDPAGHKGTFGTVAVIGGCAAGGSPMLGAPVLSARAALRGGAGLAKLVVPGPLATAALQLLPSATGVSLPVDGDGRMVAHEAAAVIDGVLDGASAIVIGPGLGSVDAGGPAVEAMTLRVVGQTERPVVVDADALNALAGMRDFAADVRAAAVLTPHPGEFRRLAATLGIKHDPTDPAQRTLAAEAMAQRLGVVCVLKGSGTVVSDGHRTWTCWRGHACMATAGSGDVLAGLIASLAAQFVKIAPFRGPLDLFDAARLGVEIHARAGERWAETRGADAGMLAEELADAIPAVMRAMRDAS
jgi:NAD(P)H-hydrate epimerase